MRIIQPGSGSKRNVLVGFYTQAAIAQMAKDLGPSAAVLNVDTTHEPLTRAEIAKRIGATEIGELALIGWSAGCHGVRDNLDKLVPDVVIALDGTHGSIPQPGNMPLGPWRALTARARQNELLFVASHIYQTYVEHLVVTATQHVPAYLSTVTVMRQLTGWPLVEPAGDAPAVRRDGDLVVYSWRSKDIDAHAHVDQVQRVGPLLVRDWIVPRWGGPIATSAETVAGLLASASEPPPDTDPAPDTRRKPDAPAGQGQAFPHGYRCSVFELIQDAKACGTWRPRGSGYSPQVGDLIVSARKGEEPEHGGSGHVEIVIGTGAKLTTVGGNEKNTWTSEAYDPKQPDFRGYIERGKLGELAVSVALEEFAAHVHETPGLGATPRISEYHAGARRDGSPLAGMPGHESEGGSPLGKKASDEIPWCASAASFCTYQAAKLL